MVVVVVVRLYLKNGVLMANNNVTAAQNSNEVVRVKRDPVSGRHDIVHVENDVTETCLL